MTTKRNADVNVNVKSYLLYILTPGPVPPRGNTSIALTLGLDVSTFYATS